jgi:hypothetical protein
MKVSPSINPIKYDIVFDSFTPLSDQFARFDQTDELVE